MTGGFARLVARWYVPAFLLLLFLSGCSLFERHPAPIVEVPPCPASDACVETLPEPASEPVAVAEPPPEPEEPPETPQHPRKPHRVVPKPQPAPPPPPPPVAPPPPPPPPLVTVRRLTPEQSHGLLDSEVQRPDGKVIGRVIDMVVNTKGQPDQIIVNLSGFMGVGDRKMNFPLTVFRFNGSATRKVPITLNVPNGAAPAVAQVKPKTQPNAPVPITLDMSDSKAFRKDGNRVGRVVDVLIDGAAQPQAVVLDVSNSIGHDVRNIAVNWSSLMFVQKNKELQLQLEMSDAQVKASPAYESDKPVDAVSPVVVQPTPASSAAAVPSSGAAAVDMASSTRSPR
ncbi:MAG TPA: PRC-barrel domain containing protein [Pararobbsia sp.]|nr:PRC-barrel domain containing protein [Pararobbsia sp.]